MNGNKVFTSAIYINSASYRTDSVSALYIPASLLNACIAILAVKNHQSVFGNLSHKGFQFLRGYIARPRNMPLAIILRIPQVDHHAFHLRRYSLISFVLIRHNPIFDFPPFHFEKSVLTKRKAPDFSQKKTDRYAVRLFFCSLTAFGYFSICHFEPFVPCLN